jgi:hypothetical protein
MSVVLTKGTWDSELERLVVEKWKVGQAFTITDVYEFEPYFRRLYPSNSFVQEKLRQTLQHLRDRGVLEFVDDAGTYRKV